MSSFSEYKMLSNDNITELHCIRIMPQENPRGIFVFSHGMAEHIHRYIPFMEYLADNGFICVGHDHIGHGHSVENEKDLGHLPIEDGGKILVSDILSHARKASNEHKGLPVILFGHSMGSFIARIALANAEEGLFHSAVICGTGGPNGAAKAGLALMETIAHFKGGRSYSGFCEKLMFGSYNAKFQKRTQYDWLSRDDAEVDKYLADPLCGFRFTVSALAVLVSLLIKANSPETYEDTDNALPVLLISGGNDPVGDYSEGVNKVCAMYKQYGSSDVTECIYPEARHELLNETVRQEVFSDVLEWVNNKIG